MHGMVDMVCKKCKRRFGYCGEIGKPPPCRYCGFQTVPSSKDMEEIEKLKRLFTTKANAQDPAFLKSARELSGLSVGQACKLLGVSKLELEHVESGQMVPDLRLLSKMTDAYGIGEDAEEGNDEVSPRVKDV